MRNLGIPHTLSQPSLFPVQQPVVVANGVGVNSMALLIYMKRSGWRPDLILHADPGSEFPQTYDYIPVMNRALDSWGFPTITVVRYVPSNFKHWPPYYTLEENCFTNGTLPSLAFGFKSCSQKWKVAPQNKYCESWPPAIECWQQGGRVLKLVGYDAGPQYQRRCNHIGNPNDPRYEYRYPLIEIGWDRRRCIEEIDKEGWPVPHKSSCFFCPSIQPKEVEDLPANLLHRIVLMEARAKPRLHKIEGLWRRKRWRDGRRLDYRLHSRTPVTTGRRNRLDRARSTDRAGSLPAGVRGWRSSGAVLTIHSDPAWREFAWHINRARDTNGCNWRWRSPRSSNGRQRTRP